MARFKRKQLFVDPRVQGTFLLRVIIYFGAWLLATGLMTTILGLISFVTQNDFRLVDQYVLFMKIVLAASLLLLPMILYDVGVLTNRLVGPIVRLRRKMRQLGEGLRVEPVEFRDGDFWPDFAAEFNAVAARVARLEDELEVARAHEFCLTAGES